MSLLFANKMMVAEREKILAIRASVKLLVHVSKASFNYVIFAQL